MSKCPFWSTGGKKMVCNGDCPMHGSIIEETDCVFKEYLSMDTLAIKNSDDDFAFSNEGLLNFDYLKRSSSY